MFISIRNYHGVRSVDEVRRRVEREFVPALRENPGLLGHYLVDCASPESGNIVTSISMFDSWDSALASNDAARTFVRRTCCPSRPRRSAAG
jgi:hypothetical protein